MGRVIVVLRVLIAAVFLYAAYTKLREPWMMFAMALDNYQLLPQWAVLFLARTLPWFELFLGVLLLSGILLRYAAAVSTLVLGSFFAIMAYTFSKGLAIDCGCFGAGETIGVKTLVRDGLLLAASVALTWLTVRIRPFMRLQPSSAA